MLHFKTSSQNVTILSVKKRTFQSCHFWWYIFRVCKRELVLAILSKHLEMVADRWLDNDLTPTKVNNQGSRVTGSNQTITQTLPTHLQQTHSRWRPSGISSARTVQHYRVRGSVKDQMCWKDRYIYEHNCESFSFFEALTSTFYYVKKNCGTYECFFLVVSFITLMFFILTILFLC